MPAISLTTAQVIYAAHTRILELADVISESSSFIRVKNEIHIAEALIRYIRALNTDSTLTFDEESAICQHMITIGDLYDFPASPTITSTVIPTFASNVILQGEQGPAGQDGFGTDYNQFSLINNTSLDSFLITSADGAEWTYKIKNSAGTSLRVGRIGAGWISDGTIVPYQFSSMDIGDTSPVTLSVTYSAGSIILFATITSGTWDISGTRWFIPGNGSGTGIISTVLANGKIFIGDSTNTAVAQTPTGDVTINSSGVTAIGSGVIVNADISSSAAVALNKLAALTASKIVVTDSSGVITTGTPTATEVSYLAGVTSAIQTQLDSKVGSVTGAISTVVSSNLTASRAVISDALGKIAVSGTTSTELGYVSGVTSAIQTQLNAKLNLSGGTLTGTLVGINASFSQTVSAQDLVASASVVINGAGTLLVGGSSQLNSTLLVLGGIDTANDGIFHKTKILDIGDWNMDSTASVSVAHGVTASKIRTVSVTIRNDAGTATYPLECAEIGDAPGGYWQYNTTNVVLNRVAARRFDEVNFDATSYNRGWVTIKYVV